MGLQQQYPPIAPIAKRSSREALARSTYDKVVSLVVEDIGARHDTWPRAKYVQTLEVHCLPDYLYKPGLLCGTIVVFHGYQEALQLCHVVLKMHTMSVTAIGDETCVGKMEAASNTMQRVIGAP